ncbi:MAG TPA: protein phosphatase 2C domain-containing protein [Intrasporangium sp.]|uniref:protein phosphatase 2C domain-containing protein n=1 Tax=Intrasporangium sp. TaxID=1925024 RepID=UPI002D793744|nr:protein phosphatase 2C domain-containing protein [Intrasporangium sp.]HET7398721.1 protein phosphatase 2C domain-containing protein [Intrasporangium sp.]
MIQIPSPDAGVPAGRCPSCGTPHDAGAAFCEACGAGLVAGVAATRTEPATPVIAAATPQTARAGDESPLDVGWTGAVPSGLDAVGGPGAGSDVCPVCGQGRMLDGYCDNCGAPAPDPRDHWTERPASWVGGVCDIGRRHSRNEDAMALAATEPAGSRSVLVVCDGVSMATDSHIASLAAAQAARTVLDQPLPRGAGTHDAWAAGAARALGSAVTAANAAVREAVTTDVPNPPSCTLAAAVVEGGIVVAGNVGDSRVYWLPDATSEPARQLGRDDSYANERILAGVSRAEAETGPGAHSITRWLGRDAPPDLTPHVTTLAPGTAGWLLVCSDGLWNYCSDSEALRGLVHETAARVGGVPTVLAQALVDFANERGGRDNITVALARLPGQGSTAQDDGAAATAPQEGDPAHG